MAFHEKYIIPIIVLSLFQCILGQNSCGKLVTDGYTVPHGDIVLRYGEPLDITCNLHTKMLDQYGANASSRLYFTRNNDAFPAEMIETINSTSIRLHIANHTKAESDNYYCLFNSMKKKTIICMNVVIVGVPPQNVTDFSCISRNYDNLTCTWTPPKNYIKTDYNLTYYLKGRANRFIYKCPKLVKEDNGKMSCFWNVSTEPQYRQVHSTFYFSIGMNNTFGSNVNNFVFEHFKHVLPNPPQNLTAVATSPHSIHLSWVIPSSMVDFSPGLHHRILYQCEYYDKVWQFGGFITNYKKNKTLEFELEGLKYAHALCDIRVSMRSALADEHDESMWSDNATITARTNSKVPDCPPKTNIGSFEIVNIGHNNRSAYVYWQQLREEQKNGQNFSYYVKVRNHHSVRPAELTKAFVRFQNLSTSESYIVDIWSMNTEGHSVDKSTVVIPASRISEPLNFIKVAHKEDLYELSWDPPRHLEGVKDPQITNYTIFWCSNERDRPFQCVGNLNWTVVSKDKKKHNQTLPGNNIYQFAISANSRNNSSGMSWAECTVIPNRILNKIKNVWIMNVGSDFIDIGWELDCSNRIGPITKYIVYYCPVQSPVLTNCNKSTETNITVEGHVQPFKITGLKPYTIYRLTVGFIINNSTYSQTSEPLWNTTHEAAPSIPLNVESYNVTNSSISLKWKPPLQKNGVIKYYYIYYNNLRSKTLDAQTYWTLDNLESFVNYSITIEACTVQCSNRSNPISVLTKMWIPGKINQPSITGQNETHMIVVWSKPDPPRGEINYYEVKFKLENKTVKYENVTTQNYSVEGCSSGRYKEILISVRAVNIINGEHKHGPWSAEMSNACEKYTLVVYISVGVSVLILAIAMTCIFKRLYVYCKVMRTVEIKLPPGLAPVVERDLVPWNSEKHVEDIDRSSRADEELLLEQMDIRLSGESSGCSSAHESISSSLESTNHISPTDSGTEHPRSPSLSEESRRNSLRQRNVSVTRPTTNKGYVMPDAISATNWASKTSPPPPAGNYCVLGVDPTNQTETESPYVPISDINTTLQPPYTCDLSQPPPYVMTGDFIKTPNPGYVPYSATEPADKNTGYVVAGLTKDLLAPELLQCDTPKPTSIEEKPLYSKAADPTSNIKGVQFPWQQPALETTLPKSGYVTVGDAPSPKTISDVTKGYVPHRQFEAKSLKED